MIYLKKFANHQEYADAESSGLLLPNISVCVNEHEVHYNPYVPPMNIITYEASAKLAETTDSASSGLHTNAFSGTSGQLTITSHTFENGVGTIEFDGDVTGIGDSAFYECSNLTSINIPNSVTSIGGYGAFYNCSGLTSIIIPDSVTSIGDSTFYECSNLTSINIPNSVTRIMDYAFGYCTSLTSITIPDSVISISQDAFSDCSGLTSVIIGSGVTSIGRYAFYGCSDLISITCNATTAPTIQSDTFQAVKISGTLYVPSGSSGYNVWMGTGDYYLGMYNWTKVEQ